MTEPINTDVNGRNSLDRDFSLENNLDDTASPKADETIRRNLWWLLPSIVPLVANQKGSGNVELDDIRYRVIRSGWECEKFYDFHVEYLADSLGSRRGKVDFFVKVFGDNHDGTKTPPIEIEKKFYKIMQESKVVPSLYDIPGLENCPGLENVLLFGHGGRLSSEDKLVGLNDSDTRKVEEKILRNIARFNAWAYHQTSEAYGDDELRDWLKEKKPTAEKAVRYFREFLEANDSEEDPGRIEQFGEKYQVFEDIYGQNGNQLVHGDLRAQNVTGPEIGEWTEDNIKIVDLGDMAIASPLFPVAQFITSAGKKADIKRWNDELHFYKCAEANALCGVTGGRGISFAKDETKKSRARFYTSVVHTSLRGLSKMAKLRKRRPQDYERILTHRPVLESHDRDMYNNIRTAFTYLARNAGELGLGRANIGDLRCLTKELKKYEPLIA